MVEGGEKNISRVNIETTKGGDEDVTEVHAPASSKRMIIIAVVLLVIVGAVIGAFVSMGGSAPAAASTPAPVVAPITKIDKLEVTDII